MSETQEAATAPVEVTKDATPDPFSLPVEELGKAINSNPDKARLGIVDDEPEVIGEAPEETVEEQATEESEVEAAPEEDATDEEVEEPESDTSQTDPDIELLQRQVSKLERTLSSREGKYGNQQQRIDKLEQENADLRARLEGGDDYDVGRQRQQSPPTQQDSATMKYLQERAAGDALSAFSTAHGDVFENGSFKSDFVPHIQKAAANFSASDDPGQLQREVSDLLSNAYDDYRIEKLRAERESRRSEQAESLKKNKRAATLSSSSTARAAPKQSTLPDPRSLDLDKLKDAIEKGLAG